MSDTVTRTQRRDLDGPASRVMRPAAHLFVVLEGARPLAGGVRHALHGIDEVVLGRSQKRELTRDERARRLTLAFADPLLSTAHARFTRRGTGWVVEDVGSTNGTFVDGVRVTESALRDGAIIDVGSTVLTVHHALPTPTSAPADVESAALPARARGMATLLPAYAEALGELVQVSLSGVFVLLLGETGTGKEVLARGIHAISGRAGAFVPVNCGALAPSLVEGQLFGHVKGAFSGALRDEPGLVRASDQGTLLLDEIGDLPKPAQAALLRVLQEREVTPVGATHPVPVDLRVVAATHRPIVELCEDDEFRSDLYARLAGYTHELCPLSARKEDLGLLIAELLPKVAPERAAGAQIAVDLARAMLFYDWPLNVRELSQALASIAVFAHDGMFRLSRAPDTLKQAKLATAATARSAPAPTPESEALREKLVAALQEHRGNVSEVARVMGRTRMQIHRWMRRFGIDPAAHRGTPE